MNFQPATLIALLALLVTVIIQLLIAVFVYGKLTNEVSGHKSWLMNLDKKVDNHETRISFIEGAKGLNAAAIKH